MRNFVVKTKRFFELVIRQHIQNRREGFVTNDVGLTGHFYNGWRDVIGVRILILQLTLTPEDLTTFISRLSQSTLHRIKC
ncbi:hypothetical protein D3C75_916890 [compost metagenome]